MGLLERWDERNQAWADRKNAEPVKPYGSSRLYRAIFVLAMIVYVLRFIAALVNGQWLEAAIVAPLALLAIYVLGYVVWALRQRTST